MGDGKRRNRFHDAAVPALVFKTGPEAAVGQQVKVSLRDAASDIDALEGADRQGQVAGDLAEHLEEEVDRSYRIGVAGTGAIEYLRGARARLFAGVVCAEDVLHARTGRQALVGDPVEAVLEPGEQLELPGRLRREAHMARFGNQGCRDSSAPHQSGGAEAGSGAQDADREVVQVQVGRSRVADPVAGIVGQQGNSPGNGFEVIDEANPIRGKSRFQRPFGDLPVTVGELNRSVKDRPSHREADRARTL